MDTGWIKLHRKLKTKGYYKRSQYVHLWVHLLLLANHQPKEFMWNDNIIIVKEGQILTGRKQLSADTGISQTTIERILKLLENEHQIGQQKTTKYRLITIVNWATHQQADIKTDNKRTTSGQQADIKTDTNKKEYKNDKNIKNNKNITCEQGSQIAEIFKIFEETNPTINYGNKTQRSAITEMIKRIGFEKVKGSALYAVSVQTEKYAPVITNPYQLKEKLGKLIVYHSKEKQGNKVLKI